MSSVSTTPETTITQNEENKKSFPFTGLGKLLIVGIILLFFTPLIFYICHFHSRNISSDPNEWGTFGDYVGGILNPFIGLLTLLVTIYIAKEIAQLEQRHNTAILASEKERQITNLLFEQKRILTELREDAYQRIFALLQKIPLVVVTRNEEDAFKIFSGYLAFYRNNQHLFDFLENDEDAEQLLNHIESFQDLLNSEEEPTTAELTDQMGKCMETSTILFSKIQAFIIAGISLQIEEIKHTPIMPS